MENKTQDRPQLEPEPLFQYSSYIVVGTLSFLANTVLIATFLKTYRLRRRVDVQIFCGLAFADATYAFGVVAAGATRLVEIIFYPFPLATLVSAWHCMTTVFETPLFSGEFLAPLMYLSLSIERLRNVRNGSDYVEDSVTAGLIHVGLPFGVAVSVLALGWFLSYNILNVPEFSFLCFTDVAFPHAFVITTYLVEAVAGLSSCCLYAVAIISFRRSVAAKSPDREKIKGKPTEIKVKPTESKGQKLPGPPTFQSLAERRRLRQAKVTTTLSLIMLVTFTFSVLPTISKAVDSFFDMNSSIYAVITPYLALLSLMNALLSAALYWWKQVEVRQETIEMLTKCCRQRTVAASNN